MPKKTKSIENVDGDLDDLTERVIHFHQTRNLPVPLDVLHEGAMLDKKSVKKLLVNELSAYASSEAGLQREIETVLRKSRLGPNYSGRDILEIIFGNLWKSFGGTVNSRTKRFEDMKRNLVARRKSILRDRSEDQGRPLTDKLNSDWLYPFMKRLARIREPQNVESRSSRKPIARLYEKEAEIRELLLIYDRKVVQAERNGAGEKDIANIRKEFVKDGRKRELFFQRKPKKNKNYSGESIQESPQPRTVANWFKRIKEETPSEDPRKKK